MVTEPFSNLSKCSISSDLDLVFEKMADLAKTMLENTKNYVRFLIVYSIQIENSLSRMRLNFFSLAQHVY